MNIEDLEKSWIERGFSFGVGTIKAGDGIKEAVHDKQDELVFMEKGRYEFVVDKNSFIQEGGEEVLIPAGTTHSIKNLSGRDSKIYYGYKQIDL